MQIYMYNKDEAERNHCQNPVNPIIPVVIYVAIIVELFFGTMQVFAFLAADSLILGLVPWVLFLLCAVYGMKFIQRLFRGRTWATHTAFVKENNTLWAVRLVTFFEYSIEGPFYSRKASTRAVIENEKRRQELKARSAYPESYQQALVEAQTSKSITKNVDKNFRFTFNGAQSVIRLDEIRFLKETDRTEIYTYKNYRGETTELAVPKAYPGLRAEILNTGKVDHEFPFPKNSKVKAKVSENPILILLIITLGMVGLVVISLLWG